MDKKITIKDKILSFIAEKGIKKSEFFDATGIQPSNFKGKNLESQPGGDMLVKILSIYPDLSADWLLRDQGDMMKTNSITNIGRNDVQRTCGNKGKDNIVFNHKKERKTTIPEMLPTTNPNEGIPLIPYSAMAGALTAEQTVLEHECERYIVPAFKGADFLMPVKGDSMHPTYRSGDIVACQRVPMTDIFFQWNKPYVLDTNQGPLIKRIKPGHDTQHVLIISDNEDYNPFELPYEDIYAVALVIGLIRLE